MGERANIFAELLDSSEMACSLRFESMAGCPYNAFSKRGIAKLAASSCLCAAIALLLGM